MKINTTLLALTSTIALAATSNVTAAVIYTAGTGGTPSWEDIGVPQTTGSGLTYTLDNISGTVDGEAFTYSLTVSSDQNLEVAKPANVLGKAGDNLFATGDTITIAITNVNNANVEFDGFTTVNYGFAANLEGFSVNGVDYKRPGATGTTTFALTDAPAATFNAVAIGSVGLGFVEYQFSAVPEPSSSALLGLGGIALILKRRK